MPVFDVSKQIHHESFLFSKTCTVSFRQQGPSRSQLRLHVVTHTNLCCNLEQWPAAACLSHQTCMRNRCIFDVGVFMFPPCAPVCEWACVDIYVPFFSLLPGPAGTTRRERRGCMPQHTRREGQIIRCRTLFLKCIIFQFCDLLVVLITRIVLVCRALLFIFSVFVIIQYLKFQSF